MTYSIEQRGTPPYIVQGGTGREIPSHPSHTSTFKDAMKEIFSLTEGGQIARGDWSIRGSFITDASGAVVFDADNEADLAILRAIDEDHDSIEGLVIK